MCSSNLSDAANISRKTRCGNPTAVPVFRSGHMSAICARLSMGKVGVQRGRKTAGVPSFLPPRRAPRRSRRPQTANPPAEVQRKTLRPERANPPAAVRVPRSAGAEKGAAPSGRTRLRSSRTPLSPCREQEPPVRGEHAYAVRVPRTAGAEKPCRRFVHRHIKAKPRFPSVFFFICGGANRSCDRLRGAHRPDGFRCPT